MTKINLSAFGLETKFACLDRSRNDGAALDGYASIFGIPDQNGDVVEPGAFAASLARLKGADRSVKLLWQHDPAAPIGVWDEVAEDGVGLRVRGRLLTEISRGAEAAALLSAGAIDGLSIGYRTVRAEKAGAGRRLIELDLWEVSLVTFPMAPEARATQPRTAPDADEVVAQALGAALNEARAGLS